jgi:hypothetical protein
MARSSFMAIEFFLNDKQERKRRKKCMGKEEKKFKMKRTVMFG